MDINTDEIIALIREAGQIIEDRSLASLITEKGEADYVTEVDLRVEKFIESKLKDLYPDIQFMGEEKSNRDLDFDGMFWVLDPVDGTTNLIHDYKQISISLALVVKREIVLGFVFNPSTDEMFFAKKGHGAYLNNKKIHVSNVKSLSKSLISVGTSPYQKELGEYNFKTILDIFMECQDIRRLGSAALDLAYTACGRTEGFFEKRLKLWDYAAGVLLVEEAGGRASDYNGNALGLKETSEILVSNGKVHDELIAILNNSPSTKL